MLLACFLDIGLIECIWVNLRRNHNNSTVVIHMAGIFYKISYLAWIYNGGK